MTNSFIDKVSAERKVLKVINSWTSGKLQLTGLSSSAISVWSNKVGIESTKDIVKSLLVLAELCQCLSDRSHESFKTLDSSLMIKIESNLFNLKLVIDTLKQPRSDFMES